MSSSEFGGAQAQQSPSASLLGMTRKFINYVAGSPSRPAVIQDPKMSDLESSMQQVNIYDDPVRHTLTSTMPGYPQPYQQQQPGPGVNAIQPNGSYQIPGSPTLAPIQQQQQINQLPGIKSYHNSPTPPAAVPMPPPTSNLQALTSPLKKSSSVSSSPSVSKRAHAHHHLAAYNANSIGGGAAQFSGYQVFSGVPDVSVDKPAAAESAILYTQSVKAEEMLQQLQTNKDNSIALPPTLSEEDGILYDDGEITVRQRGKTAEPHIVTTQSPPAAEPSVQPSNPSVASLEDQTVVKTAAAFNEFDPLQQDWMIKFDSPAAAKLAGPPKGFPYPPTAQQQQYQQQLGTPLKYMGVKSAPNLLDALTDDIPVVTPKSLTKYSERDLEKASNELESKYVTEITRLTNSLAETDKKWREAEDAREQMKNIVDEFEKTMAQMIDDSKTEKERSRVAVEKLNEEKHRLQNELQSVGSSFQDLRIRYEELRLSQEKMRKSESILKQNVEDLKKDIMSSEQRVTAVKEHAEKKLSEANDELSKIQQTSEKEMSLMKAKLQKSELKIKTLERTIEQKTTENSELMAICDDLIKKIETA